MKILYVTASNLSKNTSANMSHNGYVQGLIENGSNLDIIMADDSFGSQDAKLSHQFNAQYFIYKSVPKIEKLRRVVRRSLPDRNAPSPIEREEKNDKNHLVISKCNIRSIIKAIFLFFFKPDPVYPLEAYWLKKASTFKSEKNYDLVISNSSPAASHRLVADLIKKERIKCKRWIQIWEDPWCYDIYGKKSDVIFQEEHALLREAQSIYYVSPLTLEYQKRYFEDCASKMNHIPLPFLSFSNVNDTNEKNISFGYFGDYYSQTRNLRPFYEALLSTGARGNIFGDSNLNLKSTERVKVSGRVTLDILEKVQNETSVLVHLCNLRGGQIPGKIYHYSATTKPILFILDGTEEEQKIIRDFFSQFNRYYFCSNNKEEIGMAIREMTAHLDDYRGSVVQEFSPKLIVKNLLNK